MSSSGFRLEGYPSEVGVDMGMVGMGWNAPQVPCLCSALCHLVVIPGSTAVARSNQHTLAFISITYFTDSAPERATRPGLIFLQEAIGLSARFIRQALKLCFTLDKQPKLCAALSQGVAMFNGDVCMVFMCFASLFCRQVGWYGGLIWRCPCCQVRWQGHVCVAWMVVLPVKAVQSAVPIH